MQCVILAGGLGTRMKPDTASVPKALLPVAGRPLAAWQLEWLASAQVGSVVYCIGHLGSAVKSFVGDGSTWGLSVGYVDEGGELRGTAGALRLAHDVGALEEDFLVLYGDSWLQVDPAEVLMEGRRRAEPALMTVFCNEGRFGPSNAVFDGSRVICYEKGLVCRPKEMRWVDYGLLAFRRHVIADRIAPGRAEDLSTLCGQLAEERLLAGFEVAERFFEVGSRAGLDDLEARLAGRPGASAGSLADS